MRNKSFWTIVFLDNFTEITAERFENLLQVILKLRCNLFARMNVKEVTLGQLYPNALGKASVLQRKVPISQINEMLQVEGTVGHDHVVKDYSLNAVSVVGGVKPISLLDGKYIVTNVKMAPSFDWCYCYPIDPFTTKHLFEAHQPKSSDDVKNGKPPTVTLDWNLDINAELTKMQNASHKTWYKNNNLDPVYIIESNKAMRDDHYEQCLTLTSGQKLPPPEKKVGRPSIRVENFPDNLLIICCQNAADVIPAPFLHRGWIIDTDKSEEIESKDTDKPKEIESKDTEMDDATNL